MKRKKRSSPIVFFAQPFDLAQKTQTLLIGDMASPEAAQRNIRFRFARDSAVNKSRTFFWCPRTRGDGIRMTSRE